MEDLKIKNRGKKIFIISTAVILLIGITIAVSWSYFSITVVGNDTAKKNIVQAGIMDVDFLGSEYFNNTNMFPIKDIDKDTLADAINFTVTSLPTSTIDSKYVISIVDIVITDNFKSADFKWELLKNGTLITSGNFSSIGNSSELELTSTPLTLNKNSSDNFVLRAWLSETANDQSNLFNGSFKGKVSVTVKSE